MKFGTLLLCRKAARTTAKSARHFSTGRLASGKVPGTFCLPPVAFRQSRNGPRQRSNAGFSQGGNAMAQVKEYIGKVKPETMPEYFCAEPRKKMLREDKCSRNPVQSRLTLNLKGKYTSSPKKKAAATLRFSKDTNRNFISGLLM